MNVNDHPPEIIEQLKANSEATRKQLTQLNHEYRVREQARRLAQIKTKIAAKAAASA